MFLYYFLPPYKGQHIAKEQYFRSRTEITALVMWPGKLACSLNEVYAKTLWKVVFVCST
jgi:hypothetical protein